jgi:O-antigen/teichoic acid export membrane protein
MLTSLVMTIISILHNVLDPIVGKLVAKEGDEFNLDLWFVFFRVCFYIGCVVGLVFYKVATPFVVLWLGDEFVLFGLTVALIAINLFFDIVKWPMEIFKYKYAFYGDIHLPVFEVLINFIISIVLVQYIGINGVIVGTIASNIIVVIFLKTFLVFKRCFKVGIGIYLVELFKNTICLLFSIIMALCLFDIMLIDVSPIELGWGGMIIYILQVIMVVLFSASLVFSLRGKFRESGVRFVRFILGNYNK